MCPVPLFLCAVPYGIHLRTITVVLVRTLIPARCRCPHSLSSSILLSYRCELYDTCLRGTCLVSLFSCLVFWNWELEACSYVAPIRALYTALSVRTLYVLQTVQRTEDLIISISFVSLEKSAVCSSPQHHEKISSKNQKLRVTCVYQLRLYKHKIIPKRISRIITLLSSRTIFPSNRFPL